MQAIVYEKYGSATNLHVTQIEKPQPSADQILVRVMATSFNGSDKEMLRGSPLYARIGGLIRPRNWVLGSDIAGIVEHVGAKVTEFKVGDAVYGEMLGYRGGLAEYVCVDGKLLAHKPAGLSFIGASAIPQAGTIAYHGIVNEGQLQAGQKMLINGAGGAGGSFAIQLAKHLGAEVTGVDNQHKLEFMQAMGADAVIDYQKEDFVRNGEQYDLILDLFATRPPKMLIDSLAPHGKYLAVGGPVRRILQLFIQNKRIKERTGKDVAMMGVEQNRDHVIAMTKFITDGHVKPAIDQVFAFNHAADALQRMLDGEALGKVVVNVSGE